MADDVEQMAAAAGVPQPVFQAIADSVADDVRRLSMEKAATAGALTAERLTWQAREKELLGLITDRDGEIEALRSQVGSLEAAVADARGDEPAEPVDPT